ANGKIGLRYTRGGVGTPFFGRDVQLRIDHCDVVVVRDDRELRQPITTIAAAARLAGVEAGAPVDLYHAATDIAPDAALVVDAHAAQLLGDWFGFACSVLEELRAELGATDTRAQLWPEHFDLGMNLGGETAGSRGTFGASPG